MAAGKQHETLQPEDSDERLVWKWLQYLWPKWRSRFGFEVVFKFVLKLFGLDVSTTKTLGEMERMRHRAGEVFNPNDNT